VGIQFPADYDANVCVVVAINRALVPIVGGLLKITEKRGFWSSAIDYQNGYDAFIALEACLMATCLTDLIEAQDRTYRLLNTAIFGQPYDIVTTDPLVVTPDIQPAVDLTVLDQDSIMGRLDRLTQLTDNSINGTETPLYTYSPSVKELIQGVIDALASDTTDLDGILSQLEIIATLVA